MGIVLLGIPVFTKGGGISYIFQPTFGYLIGFILCAFIIGKMTENLEEFRFTRIIFPVVLGLMVVYSIGVPYMYLIVKYYIGKSMTFGQAIAAGFTPYILPDLILSAVVASTATKVLPILKEQGLLIRKGVRVYEN